MDTTVLELDQAWRITTSLEVWYYHRIHVDDGSE